MSSLLVPTTKLAGFVVLRICSSDPNDVRGVIALEPSSIVAIYADDAPDDCVKVVTSAGVKFFVYGTEAEVAAKRNQALREKP